MRSRVNKTGEGFQSQLVATTTGILQQRKRFGQNYGAMTMVMSYLPTIEQLKMQGLDKWQYDIGVSRVQVHFELQKKFYFLDQRRLEILAISETGECQRFDYREESNFSNKHQISCQVGRSRLFQAHYYGSSFRIIKIDPSQRSFTVEKSGAMPGREDTLCLANFQDQFIFLFRTNRPARRYSLAEDRVEELPPPDDSQPLSACSLADKVYVFAQNWIHVLHNPGASISSQELHWQKIDVPDDVVTPRYGNVFVPLNSTEITILGGCDWRGRILGDVITFNTSTFEFKKEMEDETITFRCNWNQSANVCENTIVVLMNDQDQGRYLIKYTKGDTCVNSLQL